MNNALLVMGSIAIGVGIPMLLWAIPQDPKGEWSGWSKAGTATSSFLLLLGVIFFIAYGKQFFNIYRPSTLNARVTSNPLAGVVNTSNPVVQAVNTVVNNVRRLPPVLVNSVGNNRLRLGVPTQ